MKSIQIHSTEVTLTEEESKKLVAARNLLEDLIDCFLKTCRDNDKIGQEDNYISFGALCETWKYFDWLCDATGDETPLKTYSKYTDCPAGHFLVSGSFSENEPHLSKDGRFQILESD